MKQGTIVKIKPNLKEGVDFYRPDITKYSTPKLLEMLQAFDTALQAGNLPHEMIGSIAKMQARIHGIIAARGLS